MPLGTHIQDLQALAHHLRDHADAAGDRVAPLLREVEQAAKTAAFDALAELCRAAAEAIAPIAVDQASFAPHRAAVLDHLDALAEFAAVGAAALAEGLAVDHPAPAPFALPEDEQHFRETIGMFVTHALGAVGELEEDLLAIEGSEDKAEAVGGIRRVVHTLKAEFGVLNMASAQSLCHLVETAIDACVEGGRPFPVDAMLEFTDRMKQHLDRLARDVHAVVPPAAELFAKFQALVDGGRAEVAAAAPVAAGPALELTVGGEFVDSLPEFITEARSHLTDAEGAMVSLDVDAIDHEAIHLTFRAFHTIKGVAGFLDLKPVVELSHVTETLLDGVRSDRLTLRREDVDLVLAAGDLISQMIASFEGQPAPANSVYQQLMAKLRAAAQRSGDAPAVAVPAAAGAAPTTGAVASPATVAEADDAGTTGDAPPVVVPAARPAERGPAPRASEPGGEAKAARVERTIKVSTTRLDMLVDMVGELVIAQSMVLQDPAIQGIENQMLMRNIGQVGKITRDLQEAAMSLRMVTVKATFQKMARLVRDVAAKSGKRVALTLQGEDTELDRNVVEQIADPLVHMIRNAIDHGIELPDQRRTAGKAVEGRLALRAYHQGGSIVIEIQDDGRGLDKRRIVAKAIEKGLLPADTDAAAMHDGDAFQLIFLPGFSTAEKVTDLSGRGVGMDVVRRNIEALRGKIEIESQVGHGTTFRMRLPLTLAIIDGMIVRVGSGRYVVPTLSIEHSFRPRAEDLHELIDRGECVAVRGSVLPVYRLSAIFGQADGLTDPTQAILIVVEVDCERSCLLVDEILGQQQVVIKSLGVPGERTVGVSGGAIMSDGRVALILDLASLVEAALRVPVSAAR